MARTPDVPDGENVMNWLADNRPPQVAACVIHGDWRLDNMIMDTDSLAPGNQPTIIGVLDWEMATLGDPLMDLGNSLAYWVQADDDAFLQAMRRQPTNAPGMLTRQGVWAHYQSRSSLNVESTTFYEVYGLFRLAGILQQIWYRYHHGQTRNPAFSTFGAAAAYIIGRCMLLVAEGSRA